MPSPFDYDTCQQQAFESLAQLGACIGEYDDVTIHVEMSPFLGQIPIGDSELPRVVDLVNQVGNVRNLDLSETRITDTSATHLGRLQNITYVGLCGTSITDKALPHLKTISGLKELVLSGTAITDAAVAELEQLRDLTFLQLYGTQMSTRAIAALKKALPGVVEA